MPLPSSPIFLRICGAIAFAACLSTFLMLENWPAHALKRFEFKAFASLLVLAFPLSIAAVAIRKPGLTDVLEIHFAAFSWINVTSWLTSRLEGFAEAIYSITFTIIWIEAAVILFSEMFARPAERSPISFLLRGLLAALFGGWLAGASLWAVRMPAVVIPAAEAAAGDSPYCLVSRGGAVQSLFDLTGFRMVAPLHTIGDAHALLVMQRNGERIVMGWRYGEKRFVPLPETITRNLPLMRFSNCAPTPHAAISSGWLPF